jgi:3-isopropylmalate dehydratase small subunit
VFLVVKCPPVMPSEFNFRRRIWVVVDASGALIDDIDTDMIFHNSHLHITDIAEMGKYTFGNLNDWKDFSAKVKPGDIVIAGGNFGCGSSRQQAVDCFRSLNVSALIAVSFGAIYLRNAINCAFPVGICSELAKWNIESPSVTSGDEVEVDFESGSFVNVTKGIEIGAVKEWSTVQKDIFKTGGLLKTAK